MNKRQLYKEFGGIDEDLIEEAAIFNKKNCKSKILIKFVSAAACFVIIFGLGISLLGRRNYIDLMLSTGNVKVSYINKAPNIASSNSLIELSEKELFEKYDTTIFKGEILDIKNIVIDFNGSKEYRAIAKIKIDKVYRGLCSENEILSVLLPCAINSNVWVEDTGTVSSMRVGMTGIFMPIAYTEDSYREENGTKLYLKDIADFGFLDGERFAFLEVENGLVFSKWAYKSIENAKTLVDIEIYIESMIE